MRKSRPVPAGKILSFCLAIGLCSSNRASRLKWQRMFGIGGVTRCQHRHGRRFGEWAVDSLEFGVLVFVHNGIP